MAARIVVTEFASLDGVMEAPGGEDFKYPGWSFEFDRGDDGNQFKLDETMRADGLLIGRRTYDSFAGAWPHREGEFADKFNSMPKFVVRRRWASQNGPTRPSSASGDATAQVRKLKDELDGELQVPGSQRLVQELIGSDLVDQINLMVFPVILGTGKRAFETTRTGGRCGWPSPRSWATASSCSSTSAPPEARRRAARGATARSPRRRAPTSCGSHPPAVKVVGMSGCGNWSFVEAAHRAGVARRDDDALRAG